MITRLVVVGVRGVNDANGKTSHRVATLRGELIVTAEGDIPTEFEVQIDIDAKPKLKTRQARREEAAGK